MKRNTVIYLLLALFLLVVGYMYWDSRREVVVDDSKGNDTNNSVAINEDDFKLEYEYLGEGKWDYTVTGQLPTPCYETNLDATVAESFPEQVTVTLEITAPDNDVVCVQVIREYEESAQFLASEQATVKFVVEK